jgi:hypothetical protein
MEESARITGFFFNHAVQRFDAVWSHVKRTCKKLFQHSGDGGQDAPEEAPGNIIQKKLTAWGDQMVWLAEGDVSKLKAVNEMPVFEFFIMLNKKIEETEKEIARRGKMHNK